MIEFEFAFGKLFELVGEVLVYRDALCGDRLRILGDVGGEFVLGFEGVLYSVVARCGDRLRKRGECGGETVQAA
jgi:hypothetical protein